MGCRGRGRSRKAVVEAFPVFPLAEKAGLDQEVEWRWEVN